MAKRKKTPPKLTLADLLASTNPKLAAALETVDAAANKVTAQHKRDVITSAENNLLPGEVKASPPPRTSGPTQAPYKKGYGPPVTQKDRDADLDKRYKAALASPIVTKARVDLIKSMTPARRAQIAAQQDAINKAQARKDAATSLLLGRLSTPSPIPRQPAPTAIPRSTMGTPQQRFPTRPSTGDGINWGRVWDYVKPTVTLTPTGPVVAPAAVKATAQAAPLLALGAGKATVEKTGELGGRLLLGLGEAVTPPGQRRSAIPGLTRQNEEIAQAGIVPQEAVADAAKTIRNLAAAGGGAAYGFRHPVKQTGRALEDVHDMFIGFTQAAAMISNPEMPLDQRLEQGRQLVLETLQQYAEMYGPDTTVAEAFSYGEEHPAMAALDSFTVIAAALGAPALVGGIARGLTLRQAWNAMRFPEKARTLTLQQRGAKLPTGGRSTAGKPLTVEIPRSTSPAFRQVQAGYDVASRVAQATPGLRRLPVAEGRRAARAERRRLDKQLRRLPAEVRSIFHDASLLRRDSAYTTALATLLQKPKNFTDEEWVTAVLEDMKDMLANPEKFRLAEAGASVGEQRLINRIARAEKRMEAARVRQYGEATKNIYGEQTRLSDALDDLNDSLDANEQQRQQVESDGSLTDGQKQEALAALEEQADVLDHQAAVAQTRLEQITVDQEPVASKAREEFIATLEQIPYFAGKRRYRRVEAMVAIGDARARVWARHTGNEPSEWWDRHEFQLTRPENVPRGAFAQSRPPGKVEGLDESALLKVATRLYREHGKTSNAMPPGVKGPKGLATKARGLAQLIKDGWDGRYWYEHSGRRIREVVGNDWDAAVKIAMATAYLSRRESVINNAGAAMTAWSNYVRTGDVGLVGRFPNVNRKELNKIMKTGDWGGYKTNSFFRNILEHVDKKKYDQMFAGEDPVTVDAWMVRAMGYADDNVGLKGRYQTVEDLTKHLAEQFGLTPSQAQAAAWVAVKARDEGRGGMQSGMVHVGTGIDRTTNTLRVNWEAAPGNTYGGFPEYATWDKATQEVFARVVAEGVMQYFRDLRIPVTRGEEGPGIYKPPEGPVEFNPAQSNVLHIGSATKEDTLQKRREEEIARAEAAGEEPSLGQFERVTPDERAYYDGVVAGIGRALKQNAMPWTRPMVAERAADRTALFHPRVDLSEEDVRLLNEGVGDDWQIAVSHGDGGVWFSLVKDQGMDTATFNARVDTILDDAFGADVEHNLVEFGHEGGYVTNDWSAGDRDYQATVGNSGRPGEIAAASDRLSDHYEQARAEFDADPRGAARRYRGRERTRQQRADALRVEDEQRAPLFNQSRGSDVRGATQWLDGDDGRRVIYLTQQADASTVLHELFGHASDEMWSLYPDEFAKVETEMGVPFADWGVAEHERLATMLERYFAEGFAPTPELVPVFNRIKSWMRAIYEGMRRLLGSRIPPETRRLFEGYFGAWDDPGVSRITDYLGENKGNRVDAEYSRAAGSKVTAERDLRSLRQRNETRIYNRSLDGLVNELDDLTKQLDEAYERQTAELEAARAEADYQRQAGEEVDDPEMQFTGEDYERWDRIEELKAKVLELQSAIIIRSDKREMNLRQKTADLEKALARGLDNRRLQGAVEAMRWIADDRERILREAFGTQYDEIFANRKDLLADWLVSKGLLSPVFERGTASYFPHVLDEGFFANLKMPATALNRNVIGRTQAHLNRLHKRNHMIRWQAGDWSADPAVLLEAHARAMSYQWMSEIKGLLYNIGRPFRLGIDDQDLGSIYVINPNGTPLGPELGAAIKREASKSNTNTAHDIEDSLLGDDAALEATIKNYFDAFAIDGDKLPPGFNPAEHPELRVLDKSTVHTILRPIQGSQRGAAKLWDYGTTLARISLIYANIPGYMLTNGTGNLGLLLLQQGWHLAPTIARARRLLNDTPLRERIDYVTTTGRPYHDPLFTRAAAETGDLPLQAMRQVGRGFSPGRVIGGVEHGLITVESIVDKYPRMLAWLYEANKAGYRTRSQLIGLLDGKTAKAARDRDRVSDRATNHMVDFNRLNDYERAYLTRAFFIWPYVRGATAWPFWYAKNYPVRSAVAGNVALQLRERQQEMLGPLPPWYEELFPISKTGQRAQVMNAQLISPVSMANQQLRYAEDVIASLAGRAPDQHSARIIDVFQPILRNAISLSTSRGGYGEDKSLQELITGPDGLVKALVPFWRYYDAITNEDTVPRAFYKYDRNQRDRMLRTFVRIAPQTVSLEWTGAQAQIRGEKSTEEKVADSVGVLEKRWGKTNTGPLPNFVRRQVVMKTVYEDRLKAYATEMASRKNPNFVPSQTETGEWDVRYHPTKFEQAKIAFAVVERYMPGVAKDVPSPEQLARQRGIRVGTATADLLGEKYLRMFRKLTATVSKVDTAAKKTDLGKRLEKEGVGG